MGYVVVSFSVQCSSDTSPGMDGDGYHILRISLKYRNEDDWHFIDLEVEGKDVKDPPNKDPNGKPLGDSTKDVADKAANAVSKSDLSASQKELIKVETHAGNGPGDVQGRILVFDPRLEHADVTVTSGSKKIERKIVWVEDAPPPEYGPGQEAPPRTATKDVPRPDPDPPDPKKPPPKSKEGEPPKTPEYPPLHPPVTIPPAGTGKKVGEKNPPKRGEGGKEWGGPVPPADPDAPNPGGWTDVPISQSVATGTAPTRHVEVFGAILVEEFEVGSRARMGWESSVSPPIRMHEVAFRYDYSSARNQLLEVARRLSWIGVVVASDDSQILVLRWRDSGLPVAALGFAWTREAEVPDSLGAFPWETAIESRDRAVLAVRMYAPSWDRSSRRPSAREAGTAVQRARPLLGWAPIALPTPASAPLILPHEGIEAPLAGVPAALFESAVVPEALRSNSTLGVASGDAKLRSSQIVAGLPATVASAGAAPQRTRRFAREN